MYYILHRQHASETRGRQRTLAKEYLVWKISVDEVLATKCKEHDLIVLLRASELESRQTYRNLLSLVTT